MIFIAVSCVNAGHEAIMLTAQISELRDFDDVLSRQRPKRPRESNSHNKRAAKKPTLRRSRLKVWVI